MTCVSDTSHLSSTISNWLANAGTPGASWLAVPQAAGATRSGSGGSGSGGSDGGGSNGGEASSPEPELAGSFAECSGVQGWEQLKDRMSGREARVLELAARGVPGKRIALELGLSVSTVSQTLAVVAERLGCSGRIGLIQLASSLLGTGQAATPRPRLSPAELCVFKLLQAGLTNAQISERRGASIHTVANQVRSVLRKTKLPSRRAVATAQLTDDV